MVRVIVDIFIEYKFLRRMVCVGENEVWIIGSNKIILCVDIYGCVKEVVVINCWFWFDDILVIN